MKIQDCVALVTGSNRGLGRAYCEGLLRAGSARVYAAARDPSKIRSRDSRIVPIALDVTSVADVMSAADHCRDVSLLVNNAGVLRDSPMLGMAVAANSRRRGICRLHRHGDVRAHQRVQDQPEPGCGAVAGGVGIRERPNICRR